MLQKHCSHYKHQPRSYLKTLLAKGCALLDSTKGQSTEAFVGFLLFCFLLLLASKVRNKNSEYLGQYRLGQGFLRWEGGKQYWSLEWLLSSKTHIKLLKNIFFLFFLQLDWKRSFSLKEHMGQNSCYSVLELKCCESSCSKITYFFINYFQLFSVVVNKSNFWNALFLTGISMVFNFLMTLSQRANWVLYIKYLVKNLLTYCKYKYSWLVIDPSIYFW